MRRVTSSTSVGSTSPATWMVHGPGRSGGSLRGVSSSVSASTSRMYHRQVTSSPSPTRWASSVRVPDRPATLTTTSITLDGQPRIDGRDTEDIVRRGLSYVPEGREVFEELTVRENLLMGAYVRRDRDGIRKDFERVYAYFPILADRSQQWAGTLSGRRRGVLVADRPGQAVGYALFNLQERGIMFIGPGVPVYGGQVIGLIEAMKLFNEIEAEFKCKIIEILKEDAAPVEFGEPLFKVERL